MSLNTRHLDTFRKKKLGIGTEVRGSLLFSQNCHENPWLRSKDERGRGGESEWLKEAVIYVFVYVNRGGNGRRGWGMGPRKGGEMAGGSGTGDGIGWWIFCCNLKKGTRVSGSFAREACQ